MTRQPDRDEQKLAELGYKQDLTRVWSSFSNFAISFTIISVLAGCFTTYGQAWNNGGPIAISWGWPIIGGLILIIAFCMSELVSAYPTAGGPYWWAAKLGGPGWAWFTGWFNVIGLVAVVASVDYAAAHVRLDAVQPLGPRPRRHQLRRRRRRWARSSWCSSLMLIAPRADQHLLVAPRRAVQQRVGVLARRRRRGDHRDPRLRPRPPPELRLRLHRDDQQLRASATGMFWWYVLPLGFLLTMYTLTGYDASAHVSEETHEAEMAAAQGIWQSVFYSVLIGWFVLLAITFAATDTGAIDEAAATRRGLHERDERGLGRDRDPHLDHRPVLLRHGVRDELLAHVLRVLARPRRARAGGCGRGSTSSHVPVVVGDRRVRVSR